MLALAKDTIPIMSSDHYVDKNRYVCAVPATSRCDCHLRDYEQTLSQIQKTAMITVITVDVRVVEDFTLVYSNQGFQKLFYCGCRRD